jgi:prefoldin alpha subunit
MEKDQQQLYMQMQMIAQQTQELEAQSNLLQQQVQQLSILKNGLEDLKEGDSFSQIGAGVFVKSKLTDTKEVLVNVGSGVFVNKSLKDARATVETQIGHATKYLDQITSNLHMLNHQAATLQTQAQKA